MKCDDRNRVLIAIAAAVVGLPLLIVAIAIGHWVMDQGYLPIFVMFLLSPSILVFPISALLVPSIEVNNYVMVTLFVIAAILQWAYFFCLISSLRKLKKWISARQFNDH